MNLNDVHILSKPLVLAKDREVESLESKLWVTFPPGYREYVTKLGEGILGGHFVRVYPPWRIEKELDEWRGRIRKYWFWEKSSKILPKERAAECLIIGDTLNGDELVFHPMRSNQLFVLPRDSDKAFVTGTNLWESVEWMCDSGKLTKRFTERDFEPFDSRKQQREEKGAKATDPEGESLEDIVALALAWAKRHKKLKSAEKDFREEVGEDKKAKLLYQALVIEGKYPYQPGIIMTEFMVTDNQGFGLELGTFHWSQSESSTSYGYTPNQVNLERLAKLVKPKE